MEERNLPLQEALKLNTEAPGAGPQGAEEDFAGWIWIACWWRCRASQPRVTAAT